MRRTALATGIIGSSLLALLSACGKDHKLCSAELLECEATCINPMVDPNNCGRCGEVCGTDQVCSVGSCTAACDAPTMACGGSCVDTRTSEEHCGGCDHACAAIAECIDSACVGPLALLQTTNEVDGTIGRDLYALQDTTFRLTKLNPTTFDDDRVLDHAILPGGRVVAVAAQTAGVMELWLGSAQAGALTRLNPPLAVGAQVMPGVVVSADGSRVLFRINTGADLELWAASTATPGTAVQIDDPDDPRFTSRVFALSADGKRAAYVAEPDGKSNVRDAYVVDLSAATPGAPAHLGPTTLEAWDLRLSANGQRVILRGYDPQTGRVALYLVSASAPASAAEVGYADGAEGTVEGYTLSPDGNSVVFTGGNSFLRASLWRAELPPLNSAVQLVDGLGGDVRADFTLSPDGARVYFRQDDGGLERVFRVAVTNPGGAVALTPLSKGQDSQAADFVVSTDQRTLVYRGGADGAEGGFTEPETNGSQFQTEFAPALYYVDLSAAEPAAPELLSAPLDPEEQGIGTGYRVTADGRRVLYRADHDVATQSDAYLVEVTSSATRRKVSPPLDETSDATDVARVSLFP